MPLNIPNLDRLISYLEALPPEEFHMSYGAKLIHPCGTACCIQGHAGILFGEHVFLNAIYDSNADFHRKIIMPEGWGCSEAARLNYPLPRALRMLRYLRAEFLRTDTVVVDWDAPETVELPRKPGSPPLVIGDDKELPSSLTRFVREPATSAEV